MSTNTTKTITVVGLDGHFPLSDEEDFTELLSRVRALSLKDEAGGHVFNFRKLRDGQIYTLGMTRQQVEAAYPPPSPSNLIPRTPESLPSLPPSPPRNGIEDAGFELARQELVSRITTRAKPIVIIRSPPATGKTSLLDLTERALVQRDKNTKVIRFPLRDGEDRLDEKLEFALGVENRCEIKSLKNDTWIFIDDAQLAFDDQGFWKFVMKDLGSLGCGRIHVVIAAAYDLMSQGSTPYTFAEYPHISDLKLTSEEAERLYDGYVSKLFFADRWMGFKDTLLKLSGGHVGVLSGGISMLHRIYVDLGKILSESDALDALRDHRFRVNLNRCFPCQKLMNDAQRNVVGQTIVSGPRSGHINAGQGSIDEPALVQLVRAGILSPTGSFSCLVAQWMYFNSFYSRPTAGPESIEELIIQAVRSMSALRLVQSCGSGTFPKEAAFQQLFNEAFTKLLPPSVAVCPELNTFAKDSKGKDVTGELDFYIHGDLHWAVEILRNGDKINEHVQRFDPTNGKYRLVGHKAHLVVDCRGPRIKEVVTMHDRCTLYFAHDFKTVEFKMRERPLKSIALQN